MLYMDLSGMAQVQYHVFNANLFWMPAENLSVLSAFRYTHEAQDTFATYLALEPEPTCLLPDSLWSSCPEFGERTSDYDRFAERWRCATPVLMTGLLCRQGEWKKNQATSLKFRGKREDLLVDKDRIFWVRNSPLAPTGIQAPV